MSGDPEQEYFADGIAEDVITALSRSRWLFVVARNSSFTYKGKSVDVRQVGRELGVRYVLEGSVRKAGDRVRITAQLVDTSEGHHVWAERYDRGLEDIFAVQDEMTNQITSAIAPGIVTAEVLRAQSKDAGELGGWERLMRARWHILRFNQADFKEAIRLLEELVRHEPGNAAALSDLAFAWHFLGSFAWADDRRPRTRAAERWPSAPSRSTTRIRRRMRWRPSTSCFHAVMTMQSGAFAARSTSIRTPALHAEC